MNYQPSTGSAPPPAGINIGYLPGDPNAPPGYPPAAGYPPNPGYPPNSGYPPMHGYPPQGGGYPPVQPMVQYPPQGYPPQGPTAYPQPGGFPSSPMVGQPQPGMGYPQPGSMQPRICGKRAMSSTSQKYRNFVTEPMGEKAVNELAGVGDVISKRLKAKGFDRAYVVLGQFLVLKKQKQLFVDWMKDICGANPMQASECYQCLSDWCNEFL